MVMMLVVVVEWLWLLLLSRCWGVEAVVDRIRRVSRQWLGLLRQRLLWLRLMLMLIVRRKVLKGWRWRHRALMHLLCHRVRRVAGRVRRLERLCRRVPHGCRR